MVEIDNNKIENKARPIALGRKNFLFAGNHETAQGAAMLYSFMASCELHGINPTVWLEDVINRINSTSIQELDQLLPDKWIPKPNPLQQTV